MNIVWTGNIPKYFDSTGYLLKWKTFHDNKVMLYANNSYHVHKKPFKYLLTNSNTAWGMQHAEHKDINHQLKRIINKELGVFDMMEPAQITSAYYYICTLKDKLVKDELSLSIKKMKVLIDARVYGGSWIVSTKQ